MSKVYESSPDMMQMITAMGGNGALIPTFLAAMLMIVVLMIVAYAIHGLSRIRAEESSGHLENLLATRLARVRWLGLHGAIVLTGAAVMLMGSGLVMALAVNALSSWTVNVGDYVLAGLSYWPLVALLSGIYVLLFGLLPRMAGLALWVFFGFIAFMSWLGPLMKIDQWIMDLSPLSHIAAAPTEAVKFTPLLIMLAVGALAAAFGAIFWRRRNLV
jgi:ABC-2 type transport system permease protein